MDDELEIKMVPASEQQSREFFARMDAIRAGEQAPILLPGEPGPDDLIWPATRKPSKGGPIDASRLSKMLETLRVAARIAERTCPRCHRPAPVRCYKCRCPTVRLRVHDLRHSHASHLLAEGLDQAAIMERLGWRSPAMLNRYAHKTDKSAERAIAVLAKIVDDPADVVAEYADRRSPQESIFDAGELFGPSPNEQG